MSRPPLRPRHRRYSTTASRFPRSRLPAAPAPAAPTAYLAYPNADDPLDLPELRRRREREVLLRVRRRRRRRHLRLVPGRARPRRQVLSPLRRARRRRSRCRRGREGRRAAAGRRPPRMRRPRRPPPPASPPRRPGRSPASRSSRSSPSSPSTASAAVTPPSPGSSRSARMAGGAPFAGGAGGGAAGVDLGSMTPRQIAERLYNRVMRLDAEGKKDSIGFFAPMAIQAYQMIPDQDADTRYDLGRIAQVAGDAPRRQGRGRHDPQGRSRTISSASPSRCAPRAPWGTPRKPRPTASASSPRRPPSGRRTRRATSSTPPIWTKR